MDRNVDHRDAPRAYGVMGAVPPCDVARPRHGRDDGLFPGEVCLGLELGKNCLIISRRSITPIHLQDFGGGIDVCSSVFVALGDHSPTIVNISKSDSYR